MRKYIFIISLLAFHVIYAVEAESDSLSVAIEKTLDKMEKEGKDQAVFTYSFKTVSGQVTKVKIAFFLKNLNIPNKIYDIKSLLTFNSKDVEIFEKSDESLTNAKEQFETKKKEVEVLNKSIKATKKGSKEYEEQKKELDLKKVELKNLQKDYDKANADHENLIIKSHTKTQTEAQTEAIREAINDEYSHIIFGNSGKSIGDNKIMYEIELNVNVISTKKVVLIDYTTSKGIKTTKEVEIGRLYYMIFCSNFGIGIEADILEIMRQAKETEKSTNFLTDKADVIVTGNRLRFDNYVYKILNLPNKEQANKPVSNEVEWIGQLKCTKIKEVMGGYDKCNCSNTFKGDNKNTCCNQTCRAILKNHKNTVPNGN
ncbi:MAG: coiled-coil domain-containing protein, partial [Flavobacterium sp.]